MSLPIRTTLKDVEAICSYLATKPTGATLAEAKAILDRATLDYRKLSALKFWGLIEDDENKIKITSRGRESVRDFGAYKSNVFRDVIRDVPPYFGMIERVGHKSIESRITTEVAAFWYDNFRSQTSNSDKVLNDQAVCFFHIAQAADLGTLMIGRRGKPTRFDFLLDSVRQLIDDSNSDSQYRQFTGDSIEADESELKVSKDRMEENTDKSLTETKQVFITHGANRTILNQIKAILAYGKFEPVIAMEHESAAKPVPEKIMEHMRNCQAAVIHVSSDTVLFDKDDNEVRQINDNVLIEIGAAMALYHGKFLLLVEEGVTLPSNLQGLYECRYQGNELSMPATMKLLEALSEF